MLILYNALVIPSHCSYPHDHFQEAKIHRLLENLLEAWRSHKKLIPRQETERTKKILYLYLYTSNSLFISSSWSLKEELLGLLASSSIFLLLFSFSLLPRDSFSLETLLGSWESPLDSWLDFKNFLQRIFLSESLVVHLFSVAKDIMFSIMVPNIPVSFETFIIGSIVPVHSVTPAPLTYLFIYLSLFFSFF